MVAYQGRIARALFVALSMIAVRPVNSPAQVEAEKDHRFNLSEVLVLGDNESARSEYLFSNPQHIRVDAEGRIYVAEGQGVGRQAGTQVRVYSADGTFLQSLGRRGRGPGEFQSIQALALDSKDRLVVYDGRLRRFTRYAHFGEINSFPVPSEEHRSIFSNPEKYQRTLSFMHGLPNGDLVVFSPASPRGRRSLRQPQFRVYDSQLEARGEFGEPRRWQLPKDRFARHLIWTPIFFGGSYVLPSHSTLLLAPKLYSGFLFRYTRTDEGSWTFQRLEGRAPGHPTHEVVESPDRSFSIFTSAGIGARYRSTSHGVGQLNDGQIVHLSTTENEDGIRQLQLELFDENGTLEKVGPIDGFEHDETDFEDVEQAVSVSLLWVDRKSRLIFVDRRSGFPILRVMNLEG